MSTAALQARLKELSVSLGKIQPLVDRLRNFTASVGQGDEARVELGAEIHAGLKDAEEELELLRVEVETLETGSDARRKTSVASGEKEAERERVVAMAGRLAQDLKRCVVSPAEMNWIQAPADAGVLQLGAFTYGTTGLVGISEMLNCKPRKTPNWLSGRSESSC